MKEKTSVTLSSEVLHAIDRLAGNNRSRSAFIEDLVRQHLQAQVKAERRARDLAILNQYADEMNKDADESLADQAPERE
jgi:metal-responsive CopG/Arc/MetJ family transcriptional regulator